MNKIEDMNLEEQVGLKRLLALDPTVLTPTQRLHLRARRSYLSKEQKFKYSGVLYFSRPALYHELKTTFKFLSKFSKELIIGVVIAIVAFWIIKFSGW